jgi:hypothetical protein
MAAPTKGTKRKTTARKPAKRTAAAPATNGNGQAELQPPEQYIYRGQSDSDYDAEDTLKPAKEPIPDHPYGDRKVQVFTPMVPNGASPPPPFVVPHISTVDVTEEFLWNNHKQQLDMMHQSWAWMDLAQIPDDIQRQVVSLDLENKRRFWSEWFSGFVPPPSGELPGES